MMEEAERLGGDCDHDETEEAESRHFAEIAAAFRFYRTHSLARLRHRRRCLNRLPSEHKLLLTPTYSQHLNAIEEAIEANAALIPQILDNVGQLFENVDHGSLDEGRLKPSDFQMDKLQSTFRQIVRDWSVEGAAERKAAYAPVIAAIQKSFPEPSANSERIRIAVPGCGLGRLPWELARLGYFAQGNEFSLHMLFVSNFILNRSEAPNAHVCYPFIHQSTNNLSYQDILRPIHFPDVDPGQLPMLDEAGSGLSMAAGDFLEVYTGESGEWDAVASVFFLDTARNPIAYMQRIHAMLKPGGVWVNLGPLLYHYADTEGEDSIELPWTELRGLMNKIGFGLEIEETDGHEAAYVSNLRSLLRNSYKCIFFLARKLPLAESSS